MDWITIVDTASGTYEVDSSSVVLMLDQTGKYIDVLGAYLNLVFGWKSNER